MNLTLIFFIVLVLLYLVSEFCFYVLKITDQKFYSFFHLMGGSFIFLLINSFTKNYLISIATTLAIGILWEVHEWALWKYFLKKKKYKPETRDTRNDLVVDMTGATIALLVLEFFKISV